MSYPSDGYYSQPMGTTKPADRVEQVALISYKEEDGEFITNIKQPVYLEIGSAGRFSIDFTHVIDGAIQPVSPTLAILDGNGNAVSSSLVTVGTVTQDPAQSNRYYSDVTASSALAAGWYVVKWTASYTPTGTSTSLNIQRQRAFRFKSTTAPSQYFFKATNHA
ncbi:MAG: hypothetical protein ACYCQJ_15270 [Nitrososphaerales archaeon]